MSQLRYAKEYECFYYILSEQPLKEREIGLQKGESSNQHMSIHQHMQDDIHSKYQHNDILGLFSLNKSAKS